MPSKDIQPRLTLIPELTEYSRDQLEGFIELRRARRLEAALEYQIEMQRRADYLADKEAKMRAHHLEMLEKELIRVDKAIEAVEKRMQQLHGIILDAGMPLEE